uniref:hypothetical protein n=1 Tax=Bacillus thuringiensis TaxID=1428 RepID=UPI00155DD07E|nr:hypothetical protein [Bacillus thuringiensis]
MHIFKKENFSNETKVLFCTIILATLRFLTVFWGTASISEKNHAKKIRVKKSENISLFQDTYSVFFYTKNNTTQY